MLLTIFTNNFIYYYFYFRVQHEWDYLSINEETTEFLSQCKDLPKLKLSDDLEDIIRRSKEFPVRFPIQTIRWWRIYSCLVKVNIKRDLINTMCILIFITNKKIKLHSSSFFRLEQLKLTRPLVRLQKNVKSTYPLIHERVLLLMTRFLVYKR